MKTQDPTIKVTRMEDGYGVRLITPTGKVWYMEHKNVPKSKVGACSRDLLRWWDKMGGTSHYASRARHRAWEKARNCDNEYDRNLRNQDMNWRY